MQKVCTKCHTTKPLGAFCKTPSSKDGLNSYCRECKREYDMTRWNIPHVINIRNKKSTKQRLTRCKLSAEQYGKMLVDQGERCAICGTDDPMGHGTWHTDHDHATGKLRGLLCHHCNLGLGNFRDDITRLVKATRYLLKWR